MSRESKIKYDKTLSVPEIAKKSGVSVAAVWYYIKVNNIDRRRDDKEILINACRKYFEKHPNATWAEVAKAVKHSEKTIRKYHRNITEGIPVVDFNSKRAQKRSQRQPDNFYATHPSVPKDLLRLERFSDYILEPFCGTGEISNAIKEFGYEVDSYDLRDRGFGAIGEFFSTDYPKEYYDIISNPPYDSNLTNRIILRCIDLCVGKVAMLLPIDYLSGNARHEEVFKNHPPKTVYVYVNRIQIAKDGDFTQNVGNKVVYAWYVWQKGYKGKTELKWIVNKSKTVSPGKYAPTIQDYIEGEHLNTERMAYGNHFLPCPTKGDLYKSEPEEYDASSYLCYAFRRKEDKRKGEWIPFGNMNSGFPFKIGNITFPTSEHAYICGLFSNGTDKHIEIQRELLAEPNGYQAKRSIRRKYEAQYGRKDWEEFNVEWMLYCVWQKVQGNKEFRDLLLSIPEGAMIIENSTFKQRPKDLNAVDKPAFWGCRNEDLKDFHRLVSQYAASLGGNDAEQKRKVAEYMDDFVNYGIYEGHNTMGKILTMINRCLHDGTEPEIDYDLLSRKHIWILGSLIGEQWSDNIEVKWSFDQNDSDKESI